MDTSTSNKMNGKYAVVNGVDLYYEVYGERQSSTPLILLHGGLGGIWMFSGLIPELSRTRQVIAVDLQGHSHTGDIDRPFRFESFADDTATLIQHLQLTNADILGYSLGGGTAWQTAIRHSELVRKLVVISSPVKRQAWYPEVLAGMAAMNAEAAKMMVGSPPHQAYVQAAPNPEGWTSLVTKTSELLKQEYDWSADVAKLKMPVLIVAGDNDSFSPATIAETFALLGGGQRDAGWDGSGVIQSQFALLPGTIHYTILDQVDILLPVLLRFLDS